MKKLNILSVTVLTFCITIVSSCSKRIVLHEDGKSPEHVQIYTGNYPDTLVSGNTYYLVERRTSKGLYNTELLLQVDSPARDSLLVSARKVIVDTVMQ